MIFRRPFAFIQHALVHIDIYTNKITHCQDHQLLESVLRKWVRLYFRIKKLNKLLAIQKNQRQKINKTLT